MNLTQLETFLAVVRTGSFTKAASQVHLTQSAVSRQIQDLEESLGVQLFERLGRRVSLTPAGRVLVEDAASLLQQARNVRDRLRDFDEEMEGELRVGATVTAANTFLPPLLAGYRKSNPGVNLSLQLGRSGILVERLRSNELDVAVVGSGQNHPDLMACCAIEDALVLVGAPDHFLARRRTIRPEDLNGIAFITREPGSDTQKLLHEWLQRHKVEVNTVLAIP
jgi:DNA-binding transcriptional LysR family regulator